MMNKAQCLEFAASQHVYAEKFAKGDAGTKRKGLQCKAFALVYSDRALSRK